ncbi:hypothetical protein KAR91_58285 [Candidatus Pacearchaeota archaeon]|nr:hypothetical protein [Candidatus Pacearchaeota archaeon]
MIKFTYKDKTLAYMPTAGATVIQLKVCKDLVARRFKLKAYSIRYSSQIEPPNIDFKGL